MTCCAFRTAFQHSSCPDPLGMGSCSVGGVEGGGGRSGWRGGALGFMGFTVHEVCWLEKSQEEFRPNFGALLKCVDKQRFCIRSYLRTTQGNQCDNMKQYLTQSTSEHARRHKQRGPCLQDIYVAVPILAPELETEYEAMLI